MSRAGGRAEVKVVAEIGRELRDVIEQSGDMLTAHDTDGRYVYVSPASVRVVGYRPEELIGRDPLEFVYGDDFERVRGAVREGRREGGGFQVEYRVLRPDGSCVWVQSLVRFQRDQHGRLVGVGAVRDISAQRAGEAALAEAESQSRAIIELSGDMLSRTDPEGRWLFASPSSVQIFGLEPEELIGLRCREFTHPEDRERFDAADREVRSNGDAQVEYRVRRPDLGYVWVHVLLRARRDEHGRLLEVVQAARDISQQKRQQARLLEATQRFERAFEHAPIGMALSDLDANWLKVNRALCAITGYSEPEMLTMSFRDITHPDDLERNLDGFRGLLSGQIYKAQKRYLHADGHVIWVQLACSVICDEHGSPQHFVTQTQDITEPKKLHERLAHQSECPRQTGNSCHPDGSCTQPHGLATCQRSTAGSSAKPRRTTNARRVRQKTRELEHLATHDALTGLPNRAPASASRTDSTPTPSSCSLTPTPRYTPPRRPARTVTSSSSLRYKPPPKIGWRSSSTALDDSIVPPTRRHRISCRCHCHRAIRFDIRPLLQPRPKRQICRLEALYVVR